jgi:hypothetical protein
MRFGSTRSNTPDNNNNLTEMKLIHPCYHNMNQHNPVSELNFINLLL